NVEYTLVQGNYFKRGSGVAWFDVQDSSVCAAGNQVVNNIVDSCSNSAFYFFSQVHPIVKGNKISPIFDHMKPPIYIEHAKNGAYVGYNMVADTVIHGDDETIGVYDIQSDSLNPVLIVNNIARNFNGTSTYVATACGVTGCTFISVYFNTFSATASNSTWLSYNTHGFTLSNCIHVDIRNNIFMSNLARPVNYYFGNTQDTIVGYNDYYSALSSYTPWVSMTDPGIISVDPDFVSMTDLHLNGHTPANDSIISHGTPVFGITDDIDGDVRNVLNPTIGADEVDSTFGSGIPVFYSNNSFAVYPNPAGTFFYVNCSAENNSLKHLQIELFDLTGKLVLKKNLATNISVVQIEDLSAGFYFYRIVSGEEIEQSGKIVKGEE
ncbi:MAG TPA: T9SS type A sorting domain-containing protein, partial [Bacteroidia bacterium]|nr:T9SS type A sorting domain-containing protein [Bacteroidia bacterium]